MEGKGDSRQSDSRRQGEVALTEHFNKRLTAYATGAGAACVGVLALARPAQADIIVNNNPITISPGDEVPFQINGVTQFRFEDIKEIFHCFVGLAPVFTPITTVGDLDHRRQPS